VSRETDFTKSISVERKSYDLIAEGADVFAEERGEEQFSASLCELSS